MVPLLEPPLLLERGWEDAEDRESPGPVGSLGVGEGEGVRVGEVLLDVEEFPDWGLFFNSIFYKETEMDSSISLWHAEERGFFFLVSLSCFKQILYVRVTTQTLLEWTSEAGRLGWEWMSGRLISGSCRFGGEGNNRNWAWAWPCCFSGSWALASISPAARFLWAAIWERTLSALPPSGAKTMARVIGCPSWCFGVKPRLCQRKPERLWESRATPATPLEPPEEWGEW